MREPSISCEAAIEGFLLFYSMPSPDIFTKKINGFAQMLDLLLQADQAMNVHIRRYLHYLLRHRIYFLHIYAAVLNKAMEKTNKPIEEISLLDYGAGNGLLGLFAKYCGCKKVFLCDISHHFIEASRISSQKLGIEIDGYIHGDIDSFKNNFQNEKIDWVIGTDVIEHIYDIEQFFSTLKQINPELISVFTTASNPYNFLKLKKLRRMQLQDELKGGAPEDGERAGEDAHPPYLEMRKKIISDYQPGIPEDIKMKLAFGSRGKIKADIEAIVQEYITAGSFPEPPSDKWNTCHPYTGSWSERVLSAEAYEAVYEQNKFGLEITAGFYDLYSKSPKRFFNYFRNLLMKIMGKKFAPFITLTGFSKS